MAILIRSARRNRNLFTIMWLLMTAVVAWLLSLVWGRGHLHLTNRDGYIITAISFAFWLIMTANIANQLTIAVELNEDGSR
jgi:hypothetical protein